jgi:hypothetical protein
MVVLPSHPNKTSETFTFIMPTAAQIVKSDEALPPAPAFCEWLGQGTATKVLIPCLQHKQSFQREWSTHLEVWESLATGSSSREG